MPRQDSLNDQMIDVLALTHAEGNRDAVIWLQGNFFKSPLAMTPELAEGLLGEQLRATIAVANDAGCYDAADWLSRNS